MLLIDEFEQLIVLFGYLGCLVHYCNIQVQVNLWKELGESEVYIWVELKIDDMIEDRIYTSTMNLIICVTNSREYGIQVARRLKFPTINI